MKHIEYADDGYIMLGGIELPGLSEYVDIDQARLYRKGEFHVTLVGSKALAYLADRDNAIKLMQNAVAEYAVTHDLTEYELMNELRVATREERMTLVVMVALKNIDGLYDFLNEKFKTSIPVQPTHITLYSLDPEVGISLNSAEQIESASRIVSLPEVANALAGQ